MTRPYHLELTPADLTSEVATVTLTGAGVAPGLHAEVLWLAFAPLPRHPGLEVRVQLVLHTDPAAVTPVRFVRVDRRDVPSALTHAVATTVARRLPDPDFLTELANAAAALTPDPQTMLQQGRSRDEAWAALFLALAAVGADAATVTAAEEAMTGPASTDPVALVRAITAAVTA